MSGALAEGLLVGAVAAPLVLLALCLVRPARPILSALLALAPLPALAAAMLALSGPALAVDVPFLRLSLRLDTPGALLLCPSALLWSFAGVWVAGWLGQGAGRLRFIVCWLLTMTGSIGVFAVADLPGFYFFFALVSLPAYGLIVHDDTAAARRAGGGYIAFAVLGEAFLLLGFVLLAAAAPAGSLEIRDIMAALPASPWRTPAVVFTAIGLLFKTGAVPVHVWMPPTYTAAPIPVAAALSGAAVKAGVIGLLRFLPFDDVGLAPALVLLGLVSAFYGVAVGLTQVNPRTVLAYSSISQMGVIATLLGMGWAAADATVRLDAAFYGANHALAKGGLFLAIGVMAGPAGIRGRATSAVAAVLALGLGGLPLTGGALAKQVAKSTLGDGVVGGLSLASTVGTSLLMMHFLATLARRAGQDAESAPGAAGLWAWRATALAGVGLPWLLFRSIADDPVAPLAPAALWAAAWPVAAGVGLWFVLRPWLDRLSRIPIGDWLATRESTFASLRRLGNLTMRLELGWRAWPVAGMSLLAVVVVLTAAMALRR
ncbi:complex I subunit 5 family protein [Reyranella sp.]|uniref:complex I subunit 5 family protein n=1 Tax=Reyranella sp. TaxID=1929291 RepID=UPI003783200C